MLVKNLISDPAPIPHEPDQWMRFRRLNVRRLSACVDARQSKAMDRMKVMGADGLALVRDARKGKDDDDTPSDPIESYDMDLLLSMAIAEWSYGPAEQIKAELESEDSGLDPVTAKWATREALKFNGLIPEEADAKMGN